MDLKAFIENSWEALKVLRHEIAADLRLAGEEARGVVAWQPRHRQTDSPVSGRPRNPAASGGCAGCSIVRSQTGAAG